MCLFVVPSIHYHAFSYFQLVITYSWSTKGKRDVTHMEQHHICHDRFGLLERDRFVRRACALCYGYLFPMGGQYAPLPPYYEVLVSKNKTFHGLSMPKYTYVDPLNETTLDRVCDTLDANQCVRWRACCRAAVHCCEHQRSLSQLEMSGHCPWTWDGFSCWRYAKPGHVMTSNCPEFLNHVVPASRSNWFISHCCFDF